MKSPLIHCPVAGKHTVIPLQLSFFLLLFISYSFTCQAQVTLQLKWEHEFQFAGYYAAISKGYYKDEGLDVRLHERHPDQGFIQDVVDGHAEYGVGTSELLLERNRGLPVVVLGVIFQHSALRLITRADSGIDQVSDLAGKRLMLDEGATDIKMLLKRNGLLAGQYHSVPHTFNTADLINGHVDAITAYSLNEPFELMQRGIAFRSFDPRLSGVNFYGDNLFTTERELHEHPERVKAFLRASLKGWEYAMANPDEIIDLLINVYHTKKSRAALKFEAENMRQLMLTGFVPAGYMHEGRWLDIVKTFQSLGELPQEFSLDGFLYKPSPGLLDSLWNWRWLIAVVLLLSLVLFGLVYLRSLRMMVNQRTQLLHSKSSELQSLFDNMQEILYRTDLDGRITMITPSVTKLLGYSQQAITNNRITDLYLSPDDYKGLLRQLEQQGSVSNYRVRLRKESGEPEWVAVNCHHSFDGSGRAEGVEGTIQSIASLKIAEETELKARAAAEEANAHKSRFLAAASHDLRQPLQTMRFYLDVFVEQLKGTPHLGMVEKISRSLNDTTEMLNKLLDVAQLDAGTVEVNAKEFDLSIMIRELHEQYLNAASAAGLSLRLDISDKECWVNSDPVLVKELLINLISNALRYTKKGRITLAVRSGKNLLRIEVRDTGLGIDPARQEAIFHEFVQVGNTERDRSQGVGLGLAISRRISQLLDTKLELKSQLGKGSIFFFHLPRITQAKSANVDPTETVPLEIPRSFDDKLILIIDNEPMLRDSVSMVLRQWECEVISCNDRDSALAMMQRSRRLPDAIISDCRLQGDYDGIDAVNALRVQAGKKIPALLLSGDSSHALMEKSVSAGYPLMHKPVSMEKLRKFLTRVIYSDN